MDTKTQGCVDGITPAHAGKSIPYRRIKSRVGDHPRTRGEKSVLMWLSKYRARITPAHAGKRHSPGVHRKRRGDHPRTRGEKLSIRFKSSSDLGSPPHTRGKGCGRRVRMFSMGITPAHAGKSSVAWQGRPAEEDHPRTRGEKFILVQIDCRCSRITPAHAGKSADIPGFPHLSKDHPRTRGEKDIHQKTTCTMRGSPPHTRGKALQYNGQEWDIGITPAHAGKSKKA